MYHYIKRLAIAIKEMLAPKGVVGPHMTQKTWNNDFRDKKWHFMADESQREHYKIIVNMYTSLCNGGTVLDIGCGIGILYHQFKNTVGLNNDKYLGIDISTVAVQEAITTYNTDVFKTLNYQKESLSTKFDVIIFNETLYYFDHAGKTLEKCINENLKPNGKIIISMCAHERHDKIWTYIDTNYHILDSATTTNGEGISWTIKILSIDR